VATARPRLLNFGCGSSLHPDWVNVDVQPGVPGVIAHDLRRPLPFPAASFDAAYGSHVLEHLEPDAAARLIGECRRVLRPGGVVRLVVPDLEAIARLYLENLEAATRGDAEAAFRYDWALLELYDQVARAAAGGRMAALLSQALPEGRARFIESRVGAELLRPRGEHRPARRGAWARARRVLRRLRERAAEAAALVALGRDGAAALREGLFRRSGEVHLWMYDRYSLGRALERAGFVEVRARAADESRIPDFARFGLETEERRPRKPDSLYVEAIKPG
jgi:SAM-dependent methyltransferase